ncbi:MAG: tetratricopeptide repeat protein [Candidatus Hodarchaeota archaeon]
MQNNDPKSKDPYDKKIETFDKQNKLRNTKKRNKKIFVDDLNLGLEVKFDGLNEALAQVEQLFSDKSWLKDLESHIEKELKESLNEIEKHKHGLQLVIQAANKAGKKARNEERFDTAIEIFQELDRTLLPAISNVISQETQKELKFSLSKELEKTFFKKGELAKAIKVIDSRDKEKCCTHEEYIESQIEKTYMLIQRGEFNKALSGLKDVLAESKQSENIVLIAEVKRVLGMVYRGQGAYEEALKWFKEAQELHKKVNNKEGFYNALWGVGILHHLRGEWAPAIEIWKKLLSVFEKKAREGKLTIKERTYLYAKLYHEYSLTLELCGRLQEAEQKIAEALTIVPFEDEDSDQMLGKLHLYASELYSQQNKIDEASKEIKKVRNINLRRKAQNLDPISEIYILKAEIYVLLALNKANEAREKLKSQFDSLKSNWDKALYFRLLGKIEKHDMNFGLARKALKSSLEITKEIGASTLSNELEYIELLVEMSKSGNQSVFKEAKSLLTTLEREVKDKKLPAPLLECKLLRGHLERVHANFDTAYQIYVEIIKEADSLRLFRQKSKALEGINAIEEHGQRLSTSTKELSVYRYLDDARRILEDYS